MPHTNPMIADRSTNYASRTRIVGFDETKENLTADITSYYYPDPQKRAQQQVPYIAIV